MKTKSRPVRRGVFAVFAVLLMVVVVAMAAVGIELGMLMAEKSEMQRSADAAAMAACWEYVAQLSEDQPLETSQDFARQMAQDIIGSNLVGRKTVAVDANAENLADGDVVFGRYSAFGDPEGAFTVTAGSDANAIQVRLDRTTEQNGEVTFMLARLFGVDSKPLHVTATAALARNIRGFESPRNDVDLNVLPFAVKQETWNQYIVNREGGDSWSYDKETGEVSGGGDGIVELNIYPHLTGVSGNSGTVDIGSPNNSTADLERQIRNGVSANDLSYIGGRLELNDQGILVLNGDTGISAGMKDALASIIGKPRVIMLYSEVAGNGNNANFTIVKFVGIRILEVDFKGSKNKSKRVVVQPANVVSDYVIHSDNDNTSDYVYSRVVLIK